LLPFFSLYAKGRVLGFKRAKRNQRPDISLVQIEGVKTAADTEFYLGKRIAFVYRAKREVNGSKIRCIWGRITRAHGGSGAVKARFRNNLPAKSFGASVRVVSGRSGTFGNTEQEFWEFFYSC
jgi:large subunit ribosomal protein L35Ae